MVFRRFLFALGGLALLAGIALTALWLKAPPPAAGRVATVAQATVLVAGRTIARGALLRPADLGWRRIPKDQLRPGALIRGPAVESALLGAAARRAVPVGAPLLAGEFVKPGEPGFLPAVLRPGMRAVAIAVGLAEGGAGLIMPGERVDVVLTQKFADRHLQQGLRTVGETVLRDLRVLAVDRSMRLTGQPPPPPGGLAGNAARGAPKTVTLEVTARQARALMVAGRLGELQLALRGASEPGGKRRAGPPVWAAEVSPALRMISGDAAAPAGPSAPASGAATDTALTIVRGVKVEWRCFDPAGRPLPDCSNAAAAPMPPTPAVRAAPKAAGSVAAGGLAPAS